MKLAVLVLAVLAAGASASTAGTTGASCAPTFAGRLDTGRHWMRLTFFGRIIRQSEIDGPYLLRFVALSTTTAMPNAKNDVVENAHVTAPFRCAQFSSAPFNDPSLLGAADRLDANPQGTTR